jgi:LacI family transcriptional regulator
MMNLNPSLIGMPYDNPSINYINSVQVGAQTACKRRNCHLVAEKIDLTSNGLQALRDFISQTGISGMILTPPVCNNKEVLGLFNAIGIPFVCIAPAATNPNAPSVQIDNHKAAFDMTKYLISLGHERIGFIKGHPQFLNSELRYRGYCDALKDNNLEIDNNIIKQGYFSHHSGIICGQALLKETVMRPTAIFCSNDDMAAAAIEVAHKLNISVPNDTSIAGFDDTAIASLTWPPLTTVRQPIALMAETAVELLFRYMDPTQQPAHQESATMLDFEIVIRKSTAKPPGQMV